MVFQSFRHAKSQVLLAVSVVALMAGISRAGTEIAVAPEELRLAAVQMDEYLKAQRVEHSVEASTPANGQATTVKIYGVTSLPQQEAICSGLAAGGKRDRLQGVSVQFFSIENRPAGFVQTFQPSSLPSGNSNVFVSQRPAEKAEYKLLRTVKLQEVVAK